MSGPGMFDDGTPVPELAPGESSHATLVERELSRLQARDEAQRAYDAQRIQGQHEPVNLAPYLAGAVQRPEPSYGLRVAFGGPRVLYPGLEHAVVGEMESGKSWFAAGCVAAEMRAGRRCVYLHFEEMDPSGLIEQAKVCGAYGEDLAEHLSFVGVDERRGIGKLVELRPAVVILDGVNEAMSLYGHKVREEDGAAAFRRELVKPFTAIGAAVLCCDHVTKDGDTRGRYALGSIHKGNAINGAMFMLENLIPFGRFQRGKSRVFVTKDRPGFLRSHGLAGKLPGKTWFADLVIDTRLDAPPEQAGLVLYPARPAPERPVATPEERAAVMREQLDEQVYAAVANIIDHGQEATTNRIFTLVGGRKSALGESLIRLTSSLEPRLSVEAGPNRSQIYRPISAGEEGSGPVVPGGSRSAPIKEGGGNHLREPPTDTGTTGNHTEPLGTTDLPAQTQRKPPRRAKK